MNDDCRELSCHSIHGIVKRVIRVYAPHAPSTKMTSLSIDSRNSMMLLSMSYSLEANLLECVETDHIEAKLT